MMERNGQKRGLAGGIRRGLMFSLLLAACALAPAIQARAEETAVEYDSLRQLLIDGNQDLKEANDTYNTNMKNYQEMLQELRDEQDYMRLMAKKYEDDAEAKATYSANAAILGNSASQISKRIERLNSATQTLSVEKNIDSYLLTAQTRMNSYNQMVLNAAAKEKAVEAAEAAYQATVKKQSAGAATASDVLSASDTLEQQKNLLTSYQQQADDLRFSLLSMLGLTDDGSVSIGSIPLPDLSAIDAIDYETDKEKAVNNSSTVKSVRTSSAGTMAEVEQKFAREAEAAGTAETDFYSTYQDVMAKKLSYQAAEDAWESAQITYNSLQLKKSAGMVNQTEYLEGEAAYLQAKAEWGAAYMALRQAYEAYEWELKGIG